MAAGTYLRRDEPARTEHEALKHEGICGRHSAGIVAYNEGNNALSKWLEFVAVEWCRDENWFARARLWAGYPTTRSGSESSFPLACRKNF